MEIDPRQPEHQTKIVGDFIDAVVLDPRTAQTMLDDNPWLREGSWRLGESPVHFLAIEGYAEAVEWLLERGFPVDAVNLLGDTALFDVITLKNFDMAKLLLKYGANPNVESPTYGTLREYAQLKEDDETTRFVDSICRRVSDPDVEGDI